MQDEHKPELPPTGSRSIGRIALAWGSLALAAAESLCVAAVGLSGLRVAIGLGSLIVASGPATGFHREALRIPFLGIGTAGALLTILLLWNEQKLRNKPSAAWRIQPLKKSQRRRRILEFFLAILTLVLVAAELVTHSWFHVE